MGSDQKQSLIVDTIYKSIIADSKYWIGELDYYGKNQFKEKVKGEGWTIGQVYDHLVNGTYEFQLQKINDCILRQNGSETGKKTFMGGLVFMLGKIPPFRIKGRSEQEYVPNQPPSPEKFRDEFYKYLKVLQRATKEIATCKLDYKTAHPALGMLNAVEWLKEIQMHQRHHVMQKKRLDKTLRSEFKFTPGEEVYSDV